MKDQDLFLALHHASLIVKELQRSLYFYCHILDMQENLQRPQMAFAGAWLDIGEQQIHLLVLPATEEKISQPRHGGRDRHLAIHVSQLQHLADKLDAHQIAYTMSRSGRRALFCRDPDGNALEFIQHTQASPVKK